MAVISSPAFADATVNGFKVKTTTVTSALSSGSDSIVSPSIETNTDDINDKKLIMGIDVKVAYADQAATLVLQISHNGTDWADYQTLSSDTTPNVTGNKIFIADTTNLFAPYYRIHFNPTATAIGTSGTVEFFVANK